MNNDLISRSALKEAIRKRLGISSLKYLTEQEKVIVEEIDNAPTVEERPKGEWKVIGRSGASNIFAYAWHVFCPKCNCDMFTEFTNYCPNCGEPKKEINIAEQI